eukprot:2098349-Pleurochrysis_carterae.AAC.1
MRVASVAATEMHPATAAAPPRCPSAQAAAPPALRRHGRASAHMPIRRHDRARATQPASGKLPNRSAMQTTTFIAPNDLFTKLSIHVFKVYILNQSLI